MFGFFKREDAPLPPAISLADEATSIVGFHDAMRAQTIADLHEWRARLSKNIAAETAALAAVDDAIAREVAVESDGAAVGDDAAADVDAGDTEITDTSSKPRRGKPKLAMVAS